MNIGFAIFTDYQHNIATARSKYPLNIIKTMNRYICLLRGINVSGKNKILMKDLVEVFDNIGFGNVETYIQSGNISFDAAEANTELLEQKISEGIRNRWGYDVKSFVRTKEEIREILDRCPYPVHDLKENEQLYFTLLNAQAKNEQIPPEIRDKTTDEYIIFDKSIYLCCRNGYGNTLFSNSFFEKKLKLSATTRNFATLRKLAE